MIYTKPIGILFHIILKWTDQKYILENIISSNRTSILYWFISYCLDIKWWFCRYSVILKHYLYAFTASNEAMNSCEQNICSSRITSLICAYSTGMTWILLCLYYQSSKVTLVSSSKENLWRSNKGIPCEV